MRRWLWLLFSLPMVGNANIVSPKPDAVSVTIYRASEEGNPDLANPETDAEGIALISEVRELELPAGESLIEFVGVAQTIVPQSARLESLPGVIVETNFDYKLIGPGELINNSIGQYVRLVRTDADSGKVTEQRARLVSGPSGVLLDIDGKIEALDCSGAREKLVFDSMPENLRAKPVLSAKVRVATAGKHRVRLSYLAMGFDWSANYVARIQSDGRTLDLTGWVTLANKQDTSFVDAPVQVIAGNIERDESTQAIAVSSAYYSNQCWPIGQWYWMSHSTKLDMPLAVMMPPPPPDMALIERKAMRVSDDLEEVLMIKQRDLGDYKLYELPFKTELASRQVKQVMMTHNTSVPFEKVYTYTENGFSLDSHDAAMVIPARTLLRMQNKEALGLGKPLPAGNVVVMEADGDQTLFSGMNTIKDVPIGLPVDVELGSAFDVQVSPRMLKEYTRAEERIKYHYVDMEVALINGLAEPVQFEYRQEVENGNLAIVKESSRHIMHKGLPTWAVKIPPRSHRVIKYTLRRPE